MNMLKIKKPFELYAFLEKSNCRRCGLASCLAFSAAVIQGQKQLKDCPFLDQETIEKLGGNVEKKESLEDDQGRVTRQLKGEIAQVDFSTTAPRLNAVVKNGCLGIACLGKDFWIDSSGEMASDCHINNWVHIPLLHYILTCKGRQPNNDWVAFNQLKGAPEWSNFFSHRCEESLRELADAHPDLVFEILHLFGAKQTAGITNADHSLVIYPLPKVPFLINYWEPEDDFASKLNILFDRSAEDNINMQSIYLLGRGIVEMFRQLIVKHSRDGKLF